MSEIVDAIILDIVSSYEMDIILVDDQESLPVPVRSPSHGDILVDSDVRVANEIADVISSNGRDSVDLLVDSDVRVVAYDTIYINSQEIKLVVAPIRTGESDKALISYNDQIVVRSSTAATATHTISTEVNHTMQKDVNRSSARRDLLKRRVYTLTDYFEPLMKTTDLNDDDVPPRVEPDSSATGTGANILIIPVSTTEETAKDGNNHDDIALPPKRHNLLKTARRKLRSIFKKGRKLSSCAYLDGYKSIAEDDLKPVFNDDSKPICLGLGSNGVVDLMTLTQGGEELLVAVKSFHYDDSFSRKKKKQMNKKIAMELKFMDRLRDVIEWPDIYGVCQNQLGYKIVMEFIGDEETKRSIHLTEKFLQELEDGVPHKSKMMDVMWLEVLVDTIKAIHQMHARGILHCDIDPRHVLLYGNDQNRVAGKLIDLGHASNEVKPRWVSLGKFKSKKAAYNTYQAPEFGKGTWWNRGGHSKASDVWAFGQTMLTSISELLTTSTASKLQDLITECTTVDPIERASTKHIQSELESVILGIRLNNLGCRESKLI